ncbi:ATP-binding protein [Streptomyces sp. NPDC085614]|uniref:ATP-binding protein n=1 Tax=Streptomyces sp. NPDC085614 TaxID=3365733 RepID=UPI0037D159BF
MLVSEGKQIPHLKQFPLPEVTVMYATTVPDNLIGQAGGAGMQRAAAAHNAGGARTARVPAPRKPTDDDVTQALEHRPEAASDARRTAQAVLAAWQANPGAVETVVLVISEPPTNTVEHAQAPICRRLHRERSGSRVWVGATDAGPAPHHGAWTSSCTEDEHGRGLGIVEMSADAHGTRIHTCGSTPWARLVEA